MPVYRQEIPRAKWGTKRLFDEAHVTPRSTGMNLGNLGKVWSRIHTVAFPRNDRKVLVDAISTRKITIRMDASAGAAVAPARMNEIETEMRKYLGRVKAIEGDDVIAEIGPPDDMDRWDVIIARATFRQQPKVNQEIACTIVRWGSHADVTVQILSQESLPQLKDFGIDEENMLNWASQLDV
jgi:hypothetical protein